MKKLISVLLALAMLLGLVAALSACGGEEDVVSEIIDGRFEPPIRITWAYPFIGSGQETIDAHRDKNGNPDWTNGDTSWTRYARDHYGIKMTLEWEVNEAGAFMQRLNNQIFLGEIPDFLNVLYGDYAADYIKKLYMQELITDIGDEIEEYACKAYKDTMDYVGDQVFYAATYGGKIYALPHIVVGNSMNTVYWIRSDWLDNVGKSVPANYDEFIDVLKAFANQDPDMNGVRDTYGLAINLLDGGANSIMYFNMFDAFPGHWVENKSTGKLEFGTVQPEMKTALGVLRELYAAGCVYSLDADPYALTNGCYVGITSNKAGVMEGTNNYVNAFKDLKKQNPDVDFAPVTIMSATGGPLRRSASTNTFRQYVVSKECKYPAVAVILMNMYCDLSPIVAEDMDMQEEFMYSADARYHFYNLAPCITQLYVEGPTLADRVTDALITGNTDGLYQSDLQVYNGVVNYLETGNVDSWYYERMYGIGGAVLKVQQADENVELVRTLYQGASTDGMLEHGGELNGLLTQTFFDIVSGAAELDTFDTMVEQWYDGGGRRITDEVNEWYDMMNGR